jgi:hypothetical protein
LVERLAKKQSRQRVNKMGRASRYTNQNMVTNPKNLHYLSIFNAKKQSPKKYPPNAMPSLRHWLEDERGIIFTWAVRTYRVIHKFENVLEVMKHPVQQRPMTNG